MHELIKNFTKEQLKKIARKNSCQYRVRKNRIVSSNFYLCLNTLSAYSYDWWKFAGFMDDKYVFNHSTYSSTTSRHQWKAWSLLRELNIQTFHTVYNTQANFDGMIEQSLNNYYQAAIDNIFVSNRPRTRMRDNDTIKDQIRVIERKFDLKLSPKNLLHFYRERKEQETRRNERIKESKAFVKENKLKRGEFLTREGKDDVRYLVKGFDYVNGVVKLELQQRSKWRKSNDFFNHFSPTSYYFSHLFSSLTRNNKYNTPLYKVVKK